MMDFTEVCNVPALNKETGRLVVRNIFLDIFEEKYVFYTESEMCSTKRGNSKIVWGDIILRENNNLCPKCKQFAMKFIEWGCYD